MTTRLVQIVEEYLAQHQSRRSFVVRMSKLAAASGAVLAGVRLFQPAEVGAGCGCTCACSCPFCTTCDICPGCANCDPFTTPNGCSSDSGCGTSYCWSCCINGCVVTACDYDCTNAPGNKCGSACACRCERTAACGCFPCSGSGCV